jgi:hypothetical protein
VVPGRGGFSSVNNRTPGGAGRKEASEDVSMDTIAYHQRLALLAHERGDYFSAARHYRDAANCYPSPKQGEPCLKLSEQELAREKAKGMVRGRP